MPARAVEDQDDLLGWSCSRLAGKGGEFGLEERDTDAGRQMEERAARRGMDEADEVAPGVAVLHGRQRPQAPPSAPRCAPCSMPSSTPSARATPGASHGR